MNIGIITNSLDRKHLTGPGVYLYYMLDNLLELPEARKYISLIHYHSYENPIYRCAKEVIVPRLPGLTEVVLGRNGFDILHYNSLPSLRPFFFLTAKKVLTLHGMEPVILPWIYPLYRRIERKYLWPLLIKKIDHIITVSEFTRQTAIQYWGVAPKQICTIYSGVREHFQPQSTQAVSALKDKIGGPYLLHVSNYLAIRNAEMLIKSFAALKRNKYPHRLVIIGGRWDSSPIPSLISNLQLNDHVVFVGYVDNTELPIWYSGADAFLTLSLHESFCFPAVEAMACACPVIALNSTAFPEIVGDSGLLLNEPTSPERIAKAIAELLEDNALADQLKEKGLKRVSRFNWHQNARKTWEIYQNLL